MGRNKKKKGKGGSASNGEQNERNLQYEYDSILDTLLDLLSFGDSNNFDDVTGTRDKEFYSTRQGFINCLENIAICIEPKQSKRQGEHNHLDLLRIENAASRVRSSGDAFLVALGIKRGELLRAFQKLKTLVRDTCSQLKDTEKSHPFDLTEMALMGRSMLSQFFNQIDLDRSIIAASIDSLSSIYESSGMFSSNYEDENEDSIFTSIETTTLSEKFRTWALAIREKINIDEETYENAISRVDHASVQLTEKSNRKLQPRNDSTTEKPTAGENPISNEKNDSEIADTVATNDRSLNEEQEVTQHTKNILSNNILNSDSLSQAIDQFLSNKDTGSFSGSFSSCLLLVGPSGSGKSYFCDQIYKKVLEKNKMNSSADASYKVIYPKLPVDLMGQHVGASEMILVSFFLNALNEISSSSSTNKCILILDGVNYILGGAYNETVKNQPLGNNVRSESFLISRLRATFISLVDMIKHQDSNRSVHHISGGQRFLLLCTSRSHGDNISDRFDKVYTLDPPNDDERELIITSCLSPFSCDGFQTSNLDILQNQLYLEDYDDVLTRLVGCTVGRTASEISQCCRKVIALAAAEDDYARDEIWDEDKLMSLWRKRLRIMDESLHNSAPESIRGGALDGVVDLKIYTSKELLSELAEFNLKPNECPLYGTQAKESWERLKSIIATPLCQAKQLDDLLYGNSRNNEGSQRGGKIVCAGALLTGPPGSGKSALARYCACIAALMLPSVRLLDVSCTSLIHKEVGGTERAIEKLFSAAKSAAPCILLLDGIENIAPLRGNDNTTEGTMDRALSTLLTEMDGFDDSSSSRSKIFGKEDSSNNRVAIIGITHNPNLIDSALRRPGRLEKCIVLERPDSKARCDIFIKQAEKLPLDFTNASFIEPQNIEDLGNYVAYQTNGMSAAEVKAVCTDAAMCCIREMMEKNDLNNGLNEPMIRHQHIISALEMARMGMSR